MTKTQPPEVGHWSHTIAGDVPPHWILLASTYSSGLFQWVAGNTGPKRGRVQLRLIDSYPDWRRLQQHADEAVRRLNAGTHRLAVRFKTLTVNRIEDLDVVLKPV